MESCRPPAHVSMVEISALQSGHTVEAAVPGPGNRPRVLVVEDNTDIRLFNVAALRNAGYEAEGAEDGAIAWSALQAARYDLVITDNEMPRVTGVELLRKIQSANLPLPVIMASGSPPENEFTRNGLVRPDAILLKPYRFDELVKAVKEVLNRAVGQSPAKGDSVSNKCQQL